jgi:hypothetical protein
VNFRDRLEEHQQSALGFTTILNALEEAGLVGRFISSRTYCSSGQCAHEF